MSNVVDLGTLDHRLGGLQRPVGTAPTSGLCRAVAARIGIDPLIVRLAVIGLVFAAGLGLVVYAWGTLLTPRQGGQSPITRYVPAFERWSQKTQALVVVGSSLAVVLSSASQRGVSLFPVILVVALILLLRRRGVPVNGQGQQHPSWAAPAPGGAEVPAAASIEQWRARLAAHAALANGGNDPLPVVDLYGPEPEAQPAPAQVVRTKVSWLGAVAVTVVGLGAAGAVVLLGMTPTWLWVAVAGTGAAGVSMLLWSLLVRTRRLPTLVLVLALGAGAVSSGAVLQLAEPASPVAAIPGPGETVEYEFVAEGGAVVDLSDLPLDSDTAIVIEATVSDVHVILPAEPAGFSQDAEMSRVELVHPDGQRGEVEPRPRSAASLHITAVMSDVTVEYLS